jgi:hypothetical protein
MSPADTVSNPTSTEATVPTSSAPATVHDQLVLEVTALRPWTRRPLGLFSRKRAKEVKVCASWIWRTSGEELSFPTFDPELVTQMQSVQEDLAEGVQKHLRQIYGKRTVKAWHLPQCLKEAMNTAMGEDFHHDPRLERVSAVESRIERNDMVDGPFTAGHRYTPAFNGRPSYTDIGLGDLIGSTAQSEGDKTVEQSRPEIASAPPLSE